MKLNLNWNHLFAMALIGAMGPGIANVRPAAAQSGKHYCNIVRVSDGEIRPDILNRQLSSKEPGAYSGRLQVTATRSKYRLVVEDPTGFSSSPNGGGNNVEFKTSFMGNGATEFSERPGNSAIKIKKGVTYIETHLTARRLDNSTFPAGNYLATLTLKCE